MRRRPLAFRIRVALATHLLVGMSLHALSRAQCSVATRLWQFVVHLLPTALSCMWVLPRFYSATPRVNYDGHSIRVHGVFNSIVGQSITGPLVLVSPLSPLAMRNCHANFAWRMHFYRATHQVDQRRITALINIPRSKPMADGSEPKHYLDVRTRTHYDSVHT